MQYNFPWQANVYSNILPSTCFNIFKFCFKINILQQTRSHFKSQFIYAKLKKESFTKNVIMPNYAQLRFAT